MRKRVDYDKLAAEYDHRYEGGPQWGASQALLALARDIRAMQVLEVGCGTGHWLAELAKIVPGPFGLDFSQGMLAQAARRPPSLSLAQGRAQRCPFAPAAFDLVYCVNAIHHFDDPRRFVEEAFRLLRPGGALAVLGMDPHDGRASWYVYDYFEGVYRRDLERFPTEQQIRGWMEAAGFTGVGRRVVGRILDEHAGRSVLDDPFLQKRSCSQLALLDKEAYAAGIARLEATLARAEAAGETPLFRSEIEMSMVSGWKGGDHTGTSEGALADFAPVVQIGRQDPETSVGYVK